MGQTFQNLENVSPRTYIGSGKTFEVEGAVDELEADTVIFDDELTPGRFSVLWHMVTTCCSMLACEARQVKSYHGTFPPLLYISWLMVTISKVSLQNFDACEQYRCLLGL